MKRMLMLSALLCLLLGGINAQEAETEAAKLERLRKAAEDFHDADAIALEPDAVGNGGDSAEPPDQD